MLNKFILRYRSSRHFVILINNRYKSSIIVFNLHNENKSWEIKTYECCSITSGGKIRFHLERFGLAIH